MATLYEMRGVVLDEHTMFTLSEFCQVCGVQAEVVQSMVLEGVIDPVGRTPGDWRFQGVAVVRARRALRLVNDLQINWPGAALALDLLDELERQNDPKSAPPAHQR